LRRARAADRRGVRLKDLRRAAGAMSVFLLHPSVIALAFLQVSAGAPQAVDPKIERDA